MSSLVTLITLYLLIRLMWGNSAHFPRGKSWLASLNTRTKLFCRKWRRPVSLGMKLQERDHPVYISYFFSGKNLTSATLKQYWGSASILKHSIPNFLPILSGSTLTNSNLLWSGIGHLGCWMDEAHVLGNHQNHSCHSKQLQRSSQPLFYFQKSSHCILL